MYELNGDYLNYNLTENTYWYNSIYTFNPDKFTFGKTGKFDISNVISKNSQKYILNSIWNIGAFNSENVLSAVNVYHAERSDNVYNSTRKSIWTGKVAIMYLSDYLYASTSSDCRNGNSKEECISNNWQHFNNWEATLTTVMNNNLFVYNTFSCDNNKCHSGDNCPIQKPIVPTLYLKSNVLYVKRTGTIDDMIEIVL